MTFESGESEPLSYEELRVGGKYEVLITNHYGLYRYNIKDVIVIDGIFLNSFTFDFVRKSSGFSNITGEKLSEEQVCSAVESVQGVIDSDIVFYIFTADLKKQSYIAHLELDGVIDIEHVAKCLDVFLCEVNVEYNTKRNSGRLNALKVKLLPKYSFNMYKNYYLKKGKRDIQFKVHHITGDIESFKEISNIFYGGVL